MNSIITTSLKEITLNSEFLLLKIDGKDLEIDVKKLLREPINSENIYFNATKIASFYNKKVINFLRLDGTKQYISQIEEYFKGDLKSPLIKTVKGKYHSGTWLHKELFIEFISWCDTGLRFKMHQLIKKLITHSNEIKIERQGTKTLFKQLSETIRDIYIPQQTSDNAKKFAYSTLMTLANIKVLGCKADKYARDNNIEIDKNKTIRDYLNKDLLIAIEKVEEDINGYIKYGKIYDYQKIKELILE